MIDPRSLQAGFNAGSRDQWDGFAGHRRAVSALLGAGAAPGPSRLCVLGAGNGNDLDLPALLAAHREVHLVDLDPVALAHSVGRQGVADRPGLRLFGGLDVTGILDAMAGWTPASTIRPDDLGAALDWPMSRAGLALPGPYDRVASTCLLSQVVGNAARSVGQAHPRFPDLVRAIRSGHLRLMARLAAPGALAVLITDVVSSDTLPALRSAPDPALPGILDRASLGRDCIHGVNPTDLRAAFRRDPVLAPNTEGLESLPPWRWDLHDRVYLVFAIRWRTRRDRTGMI